MTIMYDIQQDVECYRRKIYNIPGCRAVGWMRWTVGVNKNTEKCEPETKGILSGFIPIE
jgi:hypothetical protein